MLDTLRIYAQVSSFPNSEGDFSLKKQGWQPCGSQPCACICAFYCLLLLNEYFGCCAVDAHDVDAAVDVDEGVAVNRYALEQLSGDAVNAGCASVAVDGDRTCSAIDGSTVGVDVGNRRSWIAGE